jgi:polar amino acid transport system substrate-binding protein
MTSIAEDLAPADVLRAAINLGNPVLAQGTPAAPSGVTVDLAREIGTRLGLSRSTSSASTRPASHTARTVLS